MKNMKGKNCIGKGKRGVKVIDQLLINVVRRLKEESSKTIYRHIEYLRDTKT